MLLFSYHKTETVKGEAVAPYYILCRHKRNEELIDCIKLAQKPTKAQAELILQTCYFEKGNRFVSYGLNPVEFAPELTTPNEPDDKVLVPESWLKALLKRANAAEAAALKDALCVPSEVSMLIGYAKSTDAVLKYGIKVKEATHLQAAGRLVREPLLSTPPLGRGIDVVICTHCKQFHYKKDAIKRGCTNCNGQFFENTDPSNATHIIKQADENKTT